MRLLTLEATQILTSLTVDARLHFTNEDRLQQVTPETVLATVEELARSYDQEDAVRYIAGRRHVRIPDVLWELATAVVSLAPAALSPTGVTQGVAAAAAVRSLISLRQKITKLTGQQLEICRAVAVVTKRKLDAGRVLEVKEADIGEIRSELLNRHVAVAELAAMLDDLAPRVLKRVFHEGRGPYYRLCV